MGIGERARISDERRLGGGIARRFGARVESGDRGDVDDRAAARAEQGQGGAADLHRPRHIDSESPVPDRVGDGCRRIGHDQSRGIDDDVEPAGACADRRRDVLLRRHVAMDRNAAGRGRRRVERAGAEPEQDELRAFRRETFGGRPAHAGGGTGDKRGQSLDLAAHGSPHCRSTAKPVSGKVAPPSTTMVWPVTYLASREAR